MSKVEDLIQELIDWNYGTVYKGYDSEELTECLEEDTRKYIAKIIEAVKQEDSSPSDSLSRKGLK